MLIKVLQDLSGPSKNYYKNGLMNQANKLKKISWKIAIITNQPGIYKNFLKKYNFDNMLLFYCFLILWAMYGVFYQFDDITKNVGYNVLDLFSKCFVGIFFVCYFTKMFKL